MQNMDTIYISSSDGLIKKELTTDTPVPECFLWADLFNMEHTRELQMEAALKINIPSPTEINDIEVSSRLYVQGHTLYMTASFLTQSDTELSELHGVSFVLTPQSLVTVRYCDPRAFRNTHFLLSSSRKSTDTSIDIFCILIDCAVERLADVLEQVGRNIDVVGKDLFRPEEGSSANFKVLLQSIGQQGAKVSQAHESLVSLSRMLSFTVQNLTQQSDYIFDSAAQVQLQILIKDVVALNDHTAFLSNKINFLLDATLGLVNIEQNKIIKILSVAAVIFSPPTLIASIYGMNFQYMPELSWYLGYPFALGLMLLSSMTAYRYLRAKNWL